MKNNSRHTTTSCHERAHTRTPRIQTEKTKTNTHKNNRVLSHDAGTETENDKRTEKKRTLTQRETHLRGAVRVRDARKSILDGEWNSRQRVVRMRRALGRQEVTQGQRGKEAHKPHTTHTRTHTTSTQMKSIPTCSGVLWGCLSKIFL